MKKRILIWLSVLVLVTGSVAALWWAQGFWSSNLALQTNEPNISASSKTDQKSPVLGKEISGLPEYCADKLISVSGCNGMTEITSEQGNTYQLVEIGDQCWFAETPRPPKTMFRRSGYHEDDSLYTWEYAMLGGNEARSQGVCPINWHIPSTCEYSYLNVKKSEYSILGNIPGVNIRNLETNFAWKEDDRVRLFWTSSTTECPFLGECPQAASVGKSKEKTIAFTPIGHQKTAMPIRCLRN